MKITQDEKVNLICFLLGIYDLRTYKNYQQGISAPPIFLYLESCSINELTKIKNTIQLNKNKQLSQTSNEDMKTNVIPLTSTISITTTDTTTASIPNLFKAIYLKKNTEYKKRKECEENKEYEEKLFFKQMEEVDNKFQKAHKRQFNKLYKKYIISDDEKEQNNILFQIFVLSRRLKNCLPSNSDDSSVSSILGKKYDDILPRISAVLEQNRRNATRPKVELNLSNSENYIYLTQTAS